MRTLNKVQMDTIANDGNKVSVALDTSQIYAITAIGTFSDVASTGTLKFQGSNDVPVDGIAPPAFVPTNWADIPNGSVAFTAGGTLPVQVLQLCYRWVRITWTRTAGAGTFTVRINTQGF